MENEKITDKKDSKIECSLCNNFFTKQRLNFYEIELKSIYFCDLCNNEIITQMIDNGMVELPDNE